MNPLYSLATTTLSAINQRSDATATITLTADPSYSGIHRPTARKQVNKDVRFVFVDEYQDINPSQERLIHGLVGKQTQLCVVGDDDQSIFQWRGSDVAIMQGFRKRYHPMLTVELAINRRSVPSIVAIAADFAETTTRQVHQPRL